MSSAAKRNPYFPMKKYLLIALLCLPCMALAQPSKPDSLLRKLTGAKEDTSKVLLYIDIGNAYELNDPDAAGKYYLLARDLSERLHYKRGTIKFISNYTGILNMSGRFDSSLWLNRQSIRIAEDLQDGLMIAKVYANTGNSFNYLGEYDSAAYYYETSKKLFDKVNDPYLAARMDDLIQNVYFRLNQYQQAMPYGRSAVSYFRTAGKEPELGQALLNLANNYQSLGQNDSAQICYQEALVIAGETGYKALELSCLIGIGNIYFHHYDADRMRHYYETALTLSRELGNGEGEVIAGRGMALYYLLKKDFEAARKYVSASLTLADSLGLKYEQHEGLKVMAGILFAQHDIAGAERCLDSTAGIENQLRGAETQNKILLLEKKFETEQKEARIRLQQAQLQQKNVVNYILLGSAVALLIIALLSYRNYRHKQQLQQQRINELETEKQLTATAAILKGEEKERSRLAQDLHDGLGGMLSGVKYSLNNMKENLIMTPANAQAFEHSINMLDNSISEMRRVAHNLMPETLLRFGLDAAMRDFCSEMQLNGMLQVHYQSVGLKDKSIDQSLSVTVYRVTQELLNNIVKHAGATQAVVQIGATEEQLTITVEDNGKGLADEAIKAATGIGWKNIYSRVDYHKGSISIQSQPDKGTSVFIEFPLV